MSEEARARKQTFGELADRFIERLRTTKLTGGTEVTVLYQCVDQQGHAFSPIRTSITPRTAVRFPGHQAEARVFETAMHLDSLIGNINALVRNAPTGFVSFAEHPGMAVQIRGFELDIDQRSKVAPEVVMNRPYRAVSFLSDFTIAAGLLFAGQVTRSGGILPGLVSQS